MAVGKVKWFDIRKGWGFIEHDGGDDIFVHYSNIVGEGFRKLADGDEVQFEIVQGEKGLHAQNVEVLQVVDRAGAGDAS